MMYNTITAGAATPGVGIHRAPAENAFMEATS